jgi:hypothetical protein
MIYFGCVGESGHYLHRPDLHHSGRESQRVLQEAGIFPKCDGGFCPGTEYDEQRPWRRPGRQVEGHAKVTHLNGYTILAFWDRSVDHRGNSNSVFIENGTWTFDEMVAKAKEVFPTIWARFKFEVRLDAP